MNLLQEMVFKNQSAQKSENPAYAGGTTLTAAEKKKMEQMKKLDIQESVKRPLVQKSAAVVKSGPGGVIFDFGSVTGNAMADRFTNMLNQFAEPAQTKVTNFQNEQLNKSLHDYVEMGEQAYASHVMSKSQTKDQYEGKGTDEIIKAMAEKGELDCSEHGSDGAMYISGDFNKSQMRLNGEDLVAQSETDAAVVEMAKGMNLPTERELEMMSADDVAEMLKNPS